MIERKFRPFWMHCSHTLKNPLRINKTKNNPDGEFTPNHECIECGVRAWGKTGDFNYDTDFMRECKGVKRLAD